MTPDDVGQGNRERKYLSASPSGSVPLVNNAESIAAPAEVPTWILKFSRWIGIAGFFLVGLITYSILRSILRAALGPENALATILSLVGAAGAGAAFGIFVAKRIASKLYPLFMKAAKILKIAGIIVVAITVIVLLMKLFRGQ